MPEYNAELRAEVDAAYADSESCISLRWDDDDWLDYYRKVEAVYPALTAHIDAQAERIASDAERIAELERDNARLRCELDALSADLAEYASDAHVASCEGCGAPLFVDDDFVSDEDCIAGCWFAMTDAPSKRERPCYAYRVGKKSAALKDTAQ